MLNVAFYLLNNTPIAMLLYYTLNQIIFLCKILHIIILHVTNDETILCKLYLYINNRNIDKLEACDEVISLICMYAS